MVNIPNFVYQTTYNFSESVLGLPKPALRLFNVVHELHGIWKWLRLGKTYTNPENFAGLIAGHGIHLAFGDSALLRVSGACLLIARRILDCVKEKKKLERSWKKLENAWNGKYLKPVKCSWQVRSAGSSVSASTAVWWKMQFKTLWERIKRIVICFLQVCKHVFLLSMKIMDTIDAFSFDSRTTDEGVQQIFINGKICVDKLVENKEDLVKGLKENKSLIEKILQGVYLPVTADELIYTASKGLDRVEEVHNTIQKVNKCTGEFFSTCLKKWNFELFDTFGLDHLLPRSMIPPLIPPWENQNPVKKYRRFAPRDWVVQRSVVERKHASLYLKEQREKMKVEIEKTVERERKKSENRELVYVRKAPIGLLPQLPSYAS